MIDMQTGLPVGRQTAPTELIFVALTLLVYFHIISEVISFCGIKLAVLRHIIICATETVTLIV